MEVTNLCNLNCRYCYNRCANNKQIEVPLNEIVKVVNYCKNRNSEMIFSGGEPFLYSEIDGILKIIKDNKNILFHMVTNGTKVPIQKIKSLKNLRLHISLDSANEITNSVTRGSYDHKTVLNLISELGKSKTPFYVNMVITNSNMKGIEDFYEMVTCNYGIPHFNFIQYQSSAIDNWSDLGLSNSQKIECLKIIDKLNGRSCVKTNQLGCFNMCPLMTKGKNISIAIDYSGDIYPCQLLRSKDLKLGNIKELSELDAIHAQILLLQEKLRRKLTMDYGCSKCYLNNICYRGCPAEANMKNNHYFSSDDNCDIRRWQYLYKLGATVK